MIAVETKKIDLPDDNKTAVFNRMISERNNIAAGFLAEGESEAKEIRIQAEREKTITLAEAEAKAQKIRAEGDAAAAKFYAVFKEEPELAEFLRKLDALREVMKGRTTLVVDTSVPPFDLLKPGAAKLPAAK